MLPLALAARADTVVLTSGERFEGKVVRGEAGVRVNAYRSTHPGMRLGVRVVPAARIESTRLTLPLPEHDFQLRFARATSGREFRDLAAWCHERGLHEEGNYATEASNREAMFGDSHLQAARRFLASRCEGELPELPGFPFDDLYLKRALRSLDQPRGIVEDRALALGRERLSRGGHYALFVPPGHDPLIPTPLVIGLHGGGAGGANGKLVVGRGADALHLYREECARRGWLLACPSALKGGWDLRPNHRLIDALLAEMRALFNVDENRIYLAGHSMGGAGVWIHGPRLAESWAAVAAASSYDVRGLERLTATRTGIYLYHGARDPRTPVGAVRPHADRLRERGADFVYTELPDRGHELAPDVVGEMFEFFEPRRRASGTGRARPHVRPLSSFLRPVSPAERKYLPEALGKSASLRDLLRALAMGGRTAERAVEPLAAHPDPKTASRVAKLLLRAGSEPDVRSACARVLGMRKSVDQLESIGRVLQVELEPAVVADLLDAVERIGDPVAGKWLIEFVRQRVRYLRRRTDDEGMDHADWQAIAPGISVACDLIGTYRPRRAAAVLHREILETIFLSDLQIVFDSEHQWPLPAMRALARSTCGALERIRDPGTLPILERMRAAGGAAQGARVVEIEPHLARVGGFCADPAVAASVRHALATLRG